MPTDWPELAVLCRAGVAPLLAALADLGMMVAELRRIGQPAEAC